MNENLILEENTIYEIDPECLRKKREQQEKEKAKEEVCHRKSKRRENNI